VAAARFGLGCLLVPDGEAPGRPSVNPLLDRLFGSELVYTDRAGRDEAPQWAFDEAKKQ
jgi:hypothetical protein